jgi:hypothetical protein
MRVCKKAANYRTTTGKGFPSQEELLEYSVSADDNISIDEEVSSPAEANFDADRVSDSFDSGRLSDNNFQEKP